MKVQLMKELTIEYSKKK